MYVHSVYLLHGKIIIMPMHVVLVLWFGFEWVSSFGFWMIFSRLVQSFWLSLNLVASWKKSEHVYYLNLKKILVLRHGHLHLKFRYFLSTWPDFSANYKELLLVLHLFYYTINYEQPFFLHQFKRDIFKQTFI